MSTKSPKGEKENFVGWSYKKVLDELKGLENIACRIVVIDDVHPGYHLDPYFTALLSLHLKTPMKFTSGQLNEAYDYARKYPENSIVTKFEWG
jgi:hypothetical protein